MGTSLSGLTPATTFDGLLKVGDNDPLTADLKAISTGEGTDTILQLSNSALSIGGATTIVGNGTDNTTTALLVQNSNSDDILNLTDGALATLGATGKQGEINLKRPQDGLAIGKIQGTNNGLYLTNQDASNHILIGNSSTRGVSVGDGSASAMGARFGIKGSGASAGTTSLLVQNSAGSELFKLTDDGNINLGEAGASVYIQAAKNIGKSLKLGNQAHLSSFDTIDFKTWDGTAAYTEVMRITGNTDQFVGIGETTPTARLQVKGSGNDNTTTSLLVQNSDGEDMLKVTDDGGAIFKSFGASNSLILDASSGVSALEMQASNGVQRFRIQATSTSTRFTPNNTDGFTFVGSAIYTSGAFDTPSARLHIKGSGASAGTTALLVQNSAGTDLLKVKDDGLIVCDSIQLADYIRSGQTFFRNNTIYNANASLGVLNMQSDSLSFSSTSAITNDASAMFQLESTTKGFLPPRMTTTQRDAINMVGDPAVSTPATGLIIYNTTTNKAQCYNGTTWNDLF